MITDKTPERVAELSRLICEASEELEQLFREIVDEADNQLAADAQKFLTESLQSDARIMQSYTRAREQLLKTGTVVFNAQNLLRYCSELKALRASVNEFRSGGSNLSCEITIVAKRASEDGCQSREMRTQNKASGNSLSNVSYRSKEAYAWMQEHLAELPSKQWVAASTSGLVALADDREALAKKLADLGADRADLAIAFVQVAGTIYQ